MKHFFVTGGVVSGLGKGITAASLGRLLKARGVYGGGPEAGPLYQRGPGHHVPLPARGGLRDRGRSLKAAMYAGSEDFIGYKLFFVFILFTERLLDDRQTVVCGRSGAFHAFAADFGRVPRSAAIVFSLPIYLI